MQNRKLKVSQQKSFTKAFMQTEGAAKTDNSSATKSRKRMSFSTRADRAWRRELAEIFSTAPLFSENLLEFSKLKQTHEGKADREASIDSPTTENKTTTTKVGAAIVADKLVDGLELAQRISSRADLHHDSRKLQSGDVFIALHGKTHHGLDFFASAITTARLIIAEKEDFFTFFKKKRWQKLIDAKSNIGNQRLKTNAFLLLVDDVVAFANTLAAAFYRHPSKSLNVVGVTGTNGKTSIAEHLAGLYFSRGKKGTRVAVIGTLGVRYSQEIVKNIREKSRMNLNREIATDSEINFTTLSQTPHNTTPSAIDLQSILAQLQFLNAETVIVEISSHALELGRTCGLHLSSVVFTHISPDHLDFHHTMEDYFNAKAKIFDLLEESERKNKFAIVGSDLLPQYCRKKELGKNGEESVEEKITLLAKLKQLSFPTFPLARRLESVELRKPNKALSASAKLPRFAYGYGVNQHSRNVALSLRLYFWPSVEESKELGEVVLPAMFASFHAENAAFALLQFATFTAIDGVLAKSLKLETVKNKQANRKITDEVVNAVVKLTKNSKAIEFFVNSRVPGRMMTIDRLPILIDYAHTPDALEKALVAMHSLPQRDIGGRLVVLFGCGGERDKGKRTEMATAAFSLADVVVVTSDNPRSENPDRIIADMLSGVKKKAKPMLVLADRRMAIKAAVRLLSRGDVLLLAGKGHEDYQITASGRESFDEVQIVRNAVAGLLAGDIALFDLHRLCATVVRDRWRAASSFFQAGANVKSSNLKKVDRSIFWKTDKKKIALLETVNGVFFDTRKWSGEEVFFSFEGEEDAGILHLKKKHFQKLKAIVLSKKRKPEARKLLAKFSNRVKFPPIYAAIKAEANIPKFFFVDDVFAAYGELSRQKMESLLGLCPTSNVISVTGSAGKSSLKEGLAHVLRGIENQETFEKEKSRKTNGTQAANADGKENLFSAESRNKNNRQKLQAEKYRNVFSTKGNFNNHIGVPACIFMIRHFYNYYVFEIGMNHVGEIGWLASIITPRYGFITSVMAAHIGNFKNVAEIASAKAEFLAHGFFPKQTPETAVGMQKKNKSLSRVLPTLGAETSRKVSVNGESSQEEANDLLRETEITPVRKNLLFLPSNIAFFSYLEEEAKRYGWHVVPIEQDNFFLKVKVAPRVLPSMQSLPRFVSELRFSPFHQVFVGPSREKKTIKVVIDGLYPYGKELFSALVTFLATVITKKQKEQSPFFNPDHSVRGNLKKMKKNGHGGKAIKNENTGRDFKTPEHRLIRSYSPDEQRMIVEQKGINLDGKLQTSRQSYRVLSQAMKALESIPQQLMPRRFALCFSNPIVIDDAYNANPTSMAEALRFLAALVPIQTDQSQTKNGTDNSSSALPMKNLHFVLGDMLELGDVESHYHDALVHQGLSLAHSQGNCYFSFFGPRLKASCQRSFLAPSSNMVQLKDRKAIESGKKSKNIEKKTAFVKSSVATSQSLATAKQRDDRDAQSLKNSFDPLERVKAFVSKAKLLKHLEATVGKNDVVFFKASHGMGFEKIIQSYLQYLKSSDR